MKWLEQTLKELDVMTTFKNIDPAYVTGMNETIKYIRKAMKDEQEAVVQRLEQNHKLRIQEIKQQTKKIIKQLEG